MSDGGDSADLRPSSDNLVDLHISVVPMEHWVERLNYASHKIIGDTFSAGFIRVLPETSVVKLRYDIADQLGNDIFPKDYVFLKHVGRCLALVRQKQERQLKVKNFLPPHSIMPEIFVLPGQPTMYSYSVLPPIKPRIQDLYNPHSDNESSTQSMPTGQEEIPSLKPYSNINSLRASQDSLQISQDMSSNQQTQTYPSLRPGREPVGASKSRQNGYSVAQTPQQKVDGKHRRHVSGKSNYDQEIGLPKTPNNFSHAQRGKTVPGQNVDASPANFTQSSVPLSPNLEEVKPTQAKSVFREGLKKRRVRYNVPPRPESNVSSLDLDTNNPPNDLRVNPDYLHNSLHNADTPQSNSPLDDDRHALHNNHFDTANDSDSPEHFSPNHNYTRPKRKQFVDTSSHAFANGNQGAPWNSFENPAYFSQHPSVHNSTPSQLNQNMRGDFKDDRKVNKFGMGGDSSNVELNPDENPNTVLEHQSRSQRKSRTSVNENHNNSPNDDSGFVENEMSDADVYPKVTDGRLHSRELEHGLVQQKEPAVMQSLPTGDDTNRVEKEDTLQPPPSQISSSQYHKPAEERMENLASASSSPTTTTPVVVTQGTAQITTIKSIGQNGKRLGRSDRAKLWEELQKIRTERRQTEKTRQDLVKQAKVATSKMNQKRSSVRDTWKKKFFEEKKKTLPLEDICRRLQAELDTSHQRLVSAMEATKANERKAAPILPPTINPPSFKNNKRILATRLQHDMDNLRRKIEDAKVKLTGEIKLRHQAEQDVKTMRQELLAKKIRAHVAFREISRRHHFPLNIKANA